MLLKRLSTVLLLGGLLGLVPTAASAAPSPPADVREPAATQPGPAPAYDLYDHRDDDHYRCMYRCGDRYDRDRYRHRHRYDRPRYCWYRDRYGWYRARCRYHRYHW